VVKVECIDSEDQDEWMYDVGCNNTEFW
jgi:hypothetical protein